MDYEDIIHPYNLIAPMSELEFRKWLLVDSYGQTVKHQDKKVLKSVLAVLEEVELFEHCAIIRDMINDKA